MTQPISSTDDENDMNRFMFFLVFAAVLAPLAPVAAQTPTRTNDSARYRSAFDGYQPFKEQTVAPWRDVNAEVARVGGHAGALKQTTGAAGTQGAQRSAPAEGTAAPHRGHQ
jgi:hypothetical protein